MQSKEQANSGKKEASKFLSYLFLKAVNPPR